MKTIKLGTLLVLGVAIISGAALATQGTKLTVEVVDDEGKAVEGAEVRVGFEAGAGGRDEVKTGLTDRDGKFAVTGDLRGVVFYGAGKDGYYGNVNNRYHGKPADADSAGPVCSLRLKRVIDPVPMYVRRLEKQVPVLGEFVGFDLAEGDWVAPHGRGKSSDLLCKATNRFLSLEDFDAELTIRFSNPLDGIQTFAASLTAGSRLASPQLAPTDGYASTWQTKISRSPGKEHSGSDDGDDANFIFRVRTQVDEKGQVKAANYGKVYGPIRFGGFAQTRPSVAFWCYFNPSDTSRSLEFDVSKNLATEQLNKP